MHKRVLGKEQPFPVKSTLLPNTANKHTGVQKARKELTK